jgi:uncharacterized membrane protein YkoI
MKNRKKLILSVSLLTALALFAGCSTASAVSPEPSAAAVQAPAFLRLDEVKAIAYAHAGVSEAEATDRSYDFDDGAYEIEFDHGGWEYDYRIAPDGTIVKAEKTPEPTRPAETVPTETKPAETKPAEQKPAKSDKISPEEAKAIAYAHAGVRESDAHDRSWELDDGRYEIEFSHDGWEYDYLVSLEGKVLRSHREKDDDHHHSKATQPTQSNESRSDRISAEKALSIALNHAGVTDARDRDVEWDDGRWEVSFESGRTEYEYHISASGSILRWEKEQDD